MSPAALWSGADGVRTQSHRSTVQLKFGRRQGPMDFAPPHRQSLRTSHRQPRKDLVKRINVNGVELCVETFGDPSDPPVLLVGVTMLSWPDELGAALAGRYVGRH